MTIGSHILPWRQTGTQTPRLKSAWRAPLQQYKRCVGIAVLLNTRFKMNQRPRSLSAWKPNLPVSLAGKMFWPRRALRRQSRVSHLWRCAHQQPPVAYFPPAKPLQLRGPLPTSHFFCFKPRGELQEGKFIDFDSIRLVRQQQLLDTACCSLLAEGR